MRKLSVLILGYGAREHAIAWKLGQSPLIGRIYVAPGNAGTDQIATNINISDTDVAQLVAFAVDQQIDLTVIGGNDPLPLGVVDAFQAEGLCIFGPTQAAARLETSKAFAKAFMQRHAIPTPAFATFGDASSALAYLDTFESEQVVVKVSGLGIDGLGVTVCDTLDQARDAVQAYMVEQSMGDAGTQIIIEERIHGREVSFFGISDGKRIVPMLGVRDHKRVFAGDTGANTGGMGAIAPPPYLSPTLCNTLARDVLQRTIDGMAQEGNPFVGVLYAGVMLTDSGYQILEFNGRFGNPEAQVLLMLLESDLAELMLACVDGCLTPDHVQMGAGASASVVVASPGYPEAYQTGFPIHGMEAAAQVEGVELFHHGTDCVNGQLMTSSGRVIAVTAKGADLDQALERAYASAELITFPGANYRHDIGR